MTILNMSPPEVIRRDQDRRQFKAHLLLGMRSGIEGPMDAAFFTALRQRASATHPVTPLK